MAGVCLWSRGWTIPTDILFSGVWHGLQDSTERYGASRLPPVNDVEAVRLRLSQPSAVQSPTVARSAT